jgi:hypothetical protein
MSRHDLSGARWRKSSYSDGQANCVEVAAIAHGHGLAVRDSTSKDGPDLTFTPSAWRQLIEQVTAEH